MVDTKEKYPVCLNRNSRAALRRFLEPLSFLALLKARRPLRPAFLEPARAALRRKPDRGAS
jgi:hypothetical protein